MKKVLLPLCLLTVTMLLAACGGAAPQNTPEPTLTPSAGPTAEPAPETTSAPTAEPTAEPAPPDAEESGILGALRENGVYENTFFSLGCALTEDWTLYSRQQLMELSGLVSDALSDEALSALLDNGGVAYGMYAVNADGRDMNLTLEKLSAVQTLAMDPTVYIELVEQQLPAALSELGLTGVRITRGEAALAGRSMPSLQLRGEYNGTVIYETIAVCKQDEYMAILTFTSQGQNAVEDMLSAWYALE